MTLNKARQGSVGHLLEGSAVDSWPIINPLCHVPPKPPKSKTLQPLPQTSPQNSKTPAPPPLPSPCTVLLRASQKPRKSHPTPFFYVSLPVASDSQTEPSRSLTGLETTDLGICFHFLFLHTISPFGAKFEEGRFLV